MGVLALYEGLSGCLHRWPPALAGGMHTDNRHRRSAYIRRLIQNECIGLHPADIIKSSSRSLGAHRIKPFSPSDIQWVEPPTDGQQEIKNTKGI